MTLFEWFRPLISNSSSPCTNPWVMVQSANYNWYHRYFHIPYFFSSLARSWYLSFFFAFFQFYSVACRDGKVLNSGRSLSLSFFFSFFLLTITRSGRLVEIRLSVFITKSQRTFYFSFSRTDSGLWIYHLLVWSNVNFLHNSQLITLPTLSYLVLYSFCANLLHSLIMLSIVSSLSPHLWVFPTSLNDRLSLEPAW